MEIVKIIDEMLPNLEKKIKSGEAELLTLPEGKITQEIQHGVPRLVVIRNVNGARTRHAIPINNPETFSLLRKLVVESRLETDKENLEKLRKLLASLKQNPDRSNMMEMCKKFTCLSDDYLLNVFYPKPSDNDWMNMAYEQYQMYPENKNKLTSRGLYVRSKSELIICEIFYEYGIQFHYEEVLHIGKFAYAPDFTIRRADGKMFYWEHMGLTGIDEYMRRNATKLNVYINNGITPWDNLIQTYDDKDGNINVKLIRSEIENKLLI